MKNIGQYCSKKKLMLISISIINKLWKTFEKFIPIFKFYVNYWNVSNSNGFLLLIGKKNYLSQLCLKLFSQRYFKINKWYIYILTVIYNTISLYGLFAIIFGCEMQGFIF